MTTFLFTIPVIYLAIFCHILPSKPPPPEDVARITSFHRLPSLCFFYLSVSIVTLGPLGSGPLGSLSLCTRVWLHAAVLGARFPLAVTVFSPPGGINAVCLPPAVFFFNSSPSLTHNHYPAPPASLPGGCVDACLPARSSWPLSCQLVNHYMAMAADDGWGGGSTQRTPPH